jgi:hypothetical protein
MQVNQRGESEPNGFDPAGFIAQFDHLPDIE